MFAGHRCCLIILISDKNTIRDAESSTAPLTAYTAAYSTSHAAYSTVIKMKKGTLQLKCGKLTFGTKINEKWHNHVQALFYGQFCK